MEYFIIKSNSKYYYWDGYNEMYDWTEYIDDAIFYGEIENAEQVILSLIEEKEELSIIKVKLEILETIPYN